MPGAGDPPRKHDHAEPADGAAQPAQRVGQSAQRVGQDRNDSPIRRAAGSPADLRQRLNQFRDGHPSSPNHEDGSPREPAPDLSKSESAAEAHEHEPSSSGQAVGRADRAEPAEDKAARVDGQPEHAASRAEAAEDQTGPAEHADSRAARTDSQADNARDGNSEGWRAALPQLQSLWERHAERWPAEQRSPVDRSTDEPGSWRGDDGRYLDYEENLVTEHAVDRVSKAEPEVTRTMKGVEAAVPGACLVGLQYCLKGEERYKEKVAAEVRLKSERSIAEILARVPDAIRYTFECGEDHYMDSYQDICGKLEERGNELLVRRNSWDDPDYKGVNTRWLTTDGQTFEVQIHTADSFQAKQLTHVAYERLRTGVATGAERPELESFQQAVTSSIPVPRGVEAITDYRKEGY